MKKQPVEVTRVTTVTTTRIVTERVGNCIFVVESNRTVEQKTEQVKR